ncbi:MAG: pilin [Patescibacteria group bacterium]
MKIFVVIVFLMSFWLGQGVQAESIPNEIPFKVGNDLASQNLDELADQSTGISPVTLQQTIGNAVKFILALLGMIMLVIVIYSGVLWMTAGGNVENIEKAKKYLKNSVIGLFLILGAYALSAFVVSNLELITGN